jgi:ribosomal protein S18 acetylase RimI-like enzyme
MKIIPVTDQKGIAAVAALAEVIWNQHFTDIIGRQQVDYMLERYQSVEAIASQLSDGYEYYLAMINDEPLGYLGLIPDKPPGKMMLSKIYVKSSARGTGLGNALLEITRKRALETHAEAIWLTVNRGNVKTVDWYLRKGFTVTDEVKKDIGSGFYMDDYIMEIKTD